MTNLLDEKGYIKANWPAPAHITALTTTRLGGFSKDFWNSNNLALHVGDDENHVLQNRALLRDNCQLPHEPAWLNQTHGTLCVIAETETNRNADAIITRSPTHPLAMLTADCLPIALCNREGTETGLIHAGWRGLVHGIIDNTLTRMQSKPEDLMAWIGPSICGKCFEIGEEVYNSCTNMYHYVQNEFKPQANKWLADLPGIAAAVLHKAGIKDVYQSNVCTMENEHLCYSYRKSNETGRMATLIWFNNSRQEI